MVVSLSTGHTSDWEWQAVVAQMEDLSRQAYIMRLKQDPTGATYWAISQKGENYLRALERFEAEGTEARDVTADKAAPSDEWDVFISHASEDKNAIARPLAEALRARELRVWYDEFSLTVGDSLRKKIDQGLANSRFGIVILSPHFFEKHWPEQELNGLATREVGGQKVILPVWHGVGFDGVRKYSPTLADRIAVSADRGLPHIVEELLRAMEKNIPDHRAPPVGVSPKGDSTASLPGSGLAIPSPTDPDNIVLRLICEQAIQKESGMLSPEDIYISTDALKIEREDVLDSIEVLDGRGYVRISHVLGGRPRGISHLRLTTMGFVSYAEAHLVNFAGLRRAVGTAVVNKQDQDSKAIASAVGAKKYVVDQVLNEFENLGWLQLSKSLNDTVYVIKTSPQLERAFR
jgi:TIR domain